MVIKTCSIPSDIGSELPREFLKGFQAQSIVTYDFSDFKSQLLDDDVVKNNLINYSPYAASILSYLSAWCYSNQEDFTGMMVRAGIRGVECVEVSRRNDAMFISATAEVIRSDDGELAIVCFRGTELTNSISWLTDISAAPVALYRDKIQVHGGFARNFQSVWPEVVKALCCKIEEAEQGHLKFCSDAGRLKKLKALYICGHSLGGAMASLAALSLYYVKNEEIETLRQKLKGVYTYGQPMLVSGKDEHNYVQALDAYAEHAVYRHVFEKDPVPHLPPIETGPWCHVGLELRWEQDQWERHTKVDYSKQAESWAFAIGVALFLTDNLDPRNAMRRISKHFGYNFGHHSPWNYFDHLPHRPNPAGRSHAQFGQEQTWQTLLQDWLRRQQAVEDWKTNFNLRQQDMKQAIDYLLHLFEGGKSHSPDENGDHVPEADDVHETEHDSLSKEETSEEETLEGNTPAPMEPRHQEVHVRHFKALPRGEIIRLVIVMMLVYLWWLGLTK